MAGSPPPLAGWSLASTRTVSIFGTQENRSRGYFLKNKGITIE